MIQRGVHLLFAILALASNLPFANAKPDFASEIEVLIKDLVEVGDDLQKNRDLSSLQKVVGPEFEQWMSPGICLIPQKTFKKGQLKGWYPSSVFTRDSGRMLTMAFEGLNKKAPLHVLKGKAFDPYVSNYCAADLPKKKEWYGKWILYPGDYIVDQEKLCEPRKGSAPLKVEKTLLYFRPDGKNVYFGLTQIEGKWELTLIALDEDCVA